MVTKKATQRKTKRRTAAPASTGKKKSARKPTRATSAAPSHQVELRKELFFPTQVYFCDLPGAGELNKELLQEIYALRDADPEGIVRSNVKTIGAWHSATDLNRREAFSRFTTLLDNMVAQVYRDLGYHDDSRAVCDNMWANINPRHAYNRYHTHPNVLWSGVYFVQAPQGAGRLYFRDPREQAQVLNPRFQPDRDRPSEAWSEVYYEPIPGRVILFPAWLGHEVEPNLSDTEGTAGDRISISFNYIQRVTSPTG